MSEGKPGEAVWHSPWMVYGKDGKPRFSPWRFVLIGAIITHGRKVPGMFEKATGIQLPSLSKFLATGKWFRPGMNLPGQRGFDPTSELLKRRGKPFRPLSDDLCDQSRAHAHAGRYDQALDTAEQAVRLDSNSAMALYTRGQAHHYRKDYDQAVEDYSKAIQLDPVLASAYYWRGTVSSIKGEYDRAIADYNEFIRLDPKHALPYNHRGVAHAKKGEHDKALADFDKAIAIDPSSPDVYGYRAHFHRARGNLVAAIADFRAALKLNPPDRKKYEEWLQAAEAAAREKK